MARKKNHLTSKYRLLICLLLIMTIGGFIVIKYCWKGKTSPLLLIPSTEVVNFYYPSDNSPILKHRKIEIASGIENLFLLGKTWPIFQVTLLYKVFSTIMVVTQLKKNLITAKLLGI